MCRGVPVSVGLLSGRVTVIFKYLTMGSVLGKGMAAGFRSGSMLQILLDLSFNSLMAD